MKVVFTAAADEELESARAWYERERRGLGTDLFSEVAHTVAVIAPHPLRFRVVRHTLRRALVHRSPYAIYYRVLGDTLIRNPGGWLRHAAGSTLPGNNLARARARRRDRRWRIAPPHARRRTPAGGAVRSNARRRNSGAGGRELRNHLARSRHLAPGVELRRATRLGCAHARSAERTNTIAATTGGALRHLVPAVNQREATRPGTTSVDGSKRRAQWRTVIGSGRPRLSKRWVRPGHKGRTVHALRPGSPAPSPPRCPSIGSAGPGSGRSASRGRCPAGGAASCGGRAR